MKIQFIQFMDKFIGNILSYERKTPIFTIPPRGDRPPILANLVGENRDPLLKTRRLFQEPGIAREYTFPLIS